MDIRRDLLETVVESVIEFVMEIATADLKVPLEAYSTVYE